MRFTIPKQRAVIGGFLIALAALLAFVAAGGDGSGASVRFIVARHHLTAGTRLTASDLEIRSSAADDDLASHGFDSAEALMGSTMLVAVDSGELIQRSAVRTGPIELEPSFSFPIGREHALDGDLRAGDSVDVLATFSTGLDAETAVLARSVRIDTVDTSDASTSADGRLVITATFTTIDQILDVAHAAQVADLTLIRTTGATTSATGRTIITSPGTQVIGTGSSAMGSVQP